MTDELENYDDESWERRLCPSPKNIRKLGSLMRTSARMTDVALHHQPGLIRLHSSTLRTTLLQISDVCYAAFTTAHNSMDRIRMLALDAPRHLQLHAGAAASQTSSSANSQPQLVARGNRIGASTMEESSRLSKDVVDAFSNAIQLIEETLEALHTASSTSDAKDAAKVRETLLSKEQQLLDRLERLNADNEVARSEMKRAHARLDKEMDDVPISWALIANQLLEAMKDVVLPAVLSPRQSITDVISKSYDYVHDVKSISQLKQKIEANLTVDSVLAVMQQHVDSVQSHLVSLQNQIIAAEGQILGATNELGEVRAQLRRLPSNSVNLKQTAALLRNGLDNLNQLMQSWNQLSAFFLQPVNYSESSGQQHDYNSIVRVAETYIYFSQSHILPYMCRLDTSLFDESQASDQETS